MTKYIWKLSGEYSRTTRLHMMNQGLPREAFEIGPDQLLWWTEGESDTVDAVRSPCAHVT